MKEGVTQLWARLREVNFELYHIPEPPQVDFLLGERAKYITALETELKKAEPIDDSTAKQWMHQAIENSSSTLFRLLATRHATLLHDMYPAPNGELYTFAEWTLYYKGELNKDLFKGVAHMEVLRSENKEIQGFVKTRKVLIRKEYLEASQELGVSPDEGVENPILTKSVDDAYVKLLNRYGYFRDEAKTPSEKKVKIFGKSFLNNKHRRDLEAFINKLANSDYVRKQNWDVKQAQHAHAILKAVMTGKKYIKEEVEHNSDIRTRRVALYKAFRFEKSGKFFSLKDLLVVVWRAINDPEVIRDKEQKNVLITAFMQQMYEADALAHPAGENNIPGLESTSFGCSRAVAYSVSVLHGVHPDVNMTYLNAATVCEKAMTLMSRRILSDLDRSPELLEQLKRWVQEGGMDESLLNTPIDFLTYLRPQLEQEYAEFGENANRFIEDALNALKDHNIPDSLLKALFSNLAEQFLKEVFLKTDFLSREKVAQEIERVGFLAQTESLKNDWRVFLDRVFFNEDFLGGEGYVAKQKKQYCSGLDDALKGFLNNKQYLLGVLRLPVQDIVLPGRGEEASKADCSLHVPELGPEANKIS